MSGPTILHAERYTRIAVDLDAVDRLLVRLRVRSLCGMRAVIQPPLEGLLALTRPGAIQKIVDADILIEIRPVNTLALPDEAPVIALGRTGIRQARKPLEWDRDRPPVGEIDAERVGRDANGLRYRGPMFNWRSSHASCGEGRLDARGP